MDEQTRELRDALAARLEKDARSMERWIDLREMPPTCDEVDAVVRRIREAAAALRAAPVPAPVEAPTLIDLLTMWANIDEARGRGAVMPRNPDWLEARARLAIDAIRESVRIASAALTPEASPTREVEGYLHLWLNDLGEWEKLGLEYRDPSSTWADESKKRHRFVPLYRGAPPQSDGGAARAVAIATENRDAALATGNVQAAYVGEAIRRELGAPRTDPTLRLSVNAL